MKTTRYALIYDLHYPVHSEASWNELLDFLKHNKVDGIVFGGDALDMQEVAHHTKGKPIHRKQGALAQNLEGFNRQILDPIDRLLRKNAEKVFITGNHERFLTIDLIEEMPELDGVLNLDDALHLRERGYKIVGLGGHHQLGHLYAIHGDSVGGGAMPAKKAVEVWCQNVVLGHHHTLQSFTKSSPAHESKRWTATVLPCMCQRNPSYGRGRGNTWLEGFGLVTVRPNGDFNLFPVVITDGIFSLPDGKTYGNYTRTDSQ